MRQLTIDRRKWWRGRGAVLSQLVRDDGMMCCLGFYLRSCRVPVKTLLGEQRPRGIPDAIPKQAQWLLLKADHLNDVDDDSDVCQFLMRTNDAYSTDITEEDREAMVAKAFLERGIKVRFVGPRLTPDPNQPEKAKT